MIKIKVSTPWNHTDYNSRVPAAQSALYKFYFDQTKPDEVFDFWVIWGGIKGESETVICPIENVIYLTDEVHEQRFFVKKFIDQFTTIITCRKDLIHPSVIASHELNTWMVDKDFDWLCNIDFIPKSKNLSVISSDQTWLPGHKLRYAFVNKLMGHFKDKIDVYGKGFNPVKDKFDALAPYRYSIAIENSVIPGYFTEKIADCYLAHTMPIYYGCPDIQQYFNPGSMLLIDPADFKFSISQIEKLVEENVYDQMVDLIKLEKIKYLNQYHVFSKLVKILEKEFRVHNRKKRITIKNEATFHRGHFLNKSISSLLSALHVPGRFHFSIYLDQNNIYVNKK
jgi:hypothetical protein